LQSSFMSCPNGQSFKSAIQIATNVIVAFIVIWYIKVLLQFC